VAPAAIGGRHVTEHLLDVRAAAFEGRLSTVTA
jgi:hypothetical protein